MEFSQKVETAQRIARSIIFVKKNVVASKRRKFRYLLYKTLRPQLKVYNRLLTSSRKPTPDIAPAATAVLKKLLDHDMMGFEYGSGKSTLFLAKHLGYLVSLEHHAAMHEKFTDLLERKGVDNVEYRLALPHPAIEAPESAATLAELIREKGLTPKYEYHAYSKLIDEYPDAGFDIIFVDGRARVECSLYALPKLKPGGIFVLDNSERPRYKVIHEWLEDWPKVRATTGLTDTTLWIKP